jgi:type IV pilus assembly protein PilM
MKPFGLDIGSALIKVAQLEQKGKDKYLSRFGWTANPFGLIDYKNTDQQQKLATEIKKLIKDAKIEGNQVVVCLPESQIYTRILEMPSLSESELSSAISWEAEQYIPVSLEEVNLSWEVLDKGKTNTAGKMLVFLVAAPKNLIDNQLKLLDKIGLEPVAIETNNIVLARALTAPEAVVLGLDIGWKSTSIIIIDHDALVFTHSLSSGIEALTRSISGELSLDFYQAEEYRRSYGFEKQALEGKVAGAMSLVFNQIAGEVKRAIDFYKTKNQGNISVNRLILSGGGALTPGISSQLTEQLNLEVSLVDPLANLKYSQAKNWPKELISIAPLMTQSISLGLREF